jgi:hypothetical protein
MLYHAVSCCIMLYRVASCCIMLYHVVSCCIMLYHVVSCWLTLSENAGVHTTVKKAYTVKLEIMIKFHPFLLNSIYKLSPHKTTSGKYKYEEQIFKTYNNVNRIINIT